MDSWSLNICLAIWASKGKWHNFVDQIPGADVNQGLREPQYKGNHESCAVENPEVISIASLTTSEEGIQIPE